MSKQSQEAEDSVASEVHSFSKEQLLNSTGAVLSKFEFGYPSYLCDETKLNHDLHPSTDSDGDLVVVRKSHLNTSEDIIYIEHQSTTTLDLVGEQVWRGALFLADFILHNPSIFQDSCMLEIASGVGLTSIASGIIAKKVVITDVNRGDILELVRKNVKRNKDLIKADIKVEEIDFCQHESIDNISDSLKDVNVIIAADVVYHNKLTDYFFNTVLYLLSKPPSKTMFIALEKRYVFTFEDIDTVAPCYEYFLTGLEWLRYQKIDSIDWTIEEVSSNFPQYFAYERTRHLVLWKITADLK